MGQKLQKPPFLSSKLLKYKIPNHNIV